MALPQFIFCRNNFFSLNLHIQNLIMKELPPPSPPPQLFGDPYTPTPLRVRIFFMLQICFPFLSFVLLAHLSWKLKRAFLITFCSASSVCLSVRLFCFFFTFLSSSQEPLSHLNQSWHKASLVKGYSSLFKWRARFLSKGR